MHPPATNKQPLHFREIDGLRGFSTCIVLVAHISAAPFFWAWIQMDMFFVMSSFLLTRIALLKVNTPHSIIGFYRRRIERIWPLYFLVVWACFLITIALNHLMASAPYDLSVFWRYFSFSHYSEYNFSQQGSGFAYVPYLHHLWSIAIEEQFYILLPLVIVVFRYLPRPACITLLIGAALFGLGQRFAHSNMYAFSNHADAFVLGGCLAALLPWLKDHPLAARRISLSMIGLGALAFMPYFIQGYGRYFAGQVNPGFIPLPATAIIIFWGGLIAYLALNGGASHLKPLRNEFLVYMGKVSYSIYLVHYPIFKLLPKILQSLGLSGIGKPLTVTLALGLSFAAGHALYRWIDQKLQSPAPAQPAKT